MLDLIMILLTVFMYFVSYGVLTYHNYRHYWKKHRSDFTLHDILFVAPRWVYDRNATDSMEFYAIARWMPLLNFLCVLFLMICAMCRCTVGILLEAFLEWTKNIHFNTTPSLKNEEKDKDKSLII